MKEYRINPFLQYPGPEMHEGEAEQKAGAGL